MTAAASLRLGVTARLLASEDTGATEGIGETLIGDDPTAFTRFAAGLTAITADNEWAPVDALKAAVPDAPPLRPGPATLGLIRDKGTQKRHLQAAGLPVPAFELCGSLGHARAAAAQFGFPVLVKRRLGSYDGYGNRTARTRDELDAAWAALADPHEGALVEAYVPFARELAVLVVRGADGSELTYPVLATEQRDHRCHLVQLPAPIAPDVAARALEIARLAVRAVDGVGVTAVELFETADGHVSVNELAPRPHNTGHVTIEASVTSQFENHVRAVLGWPLGDPSSRAPVAVMVNVLGQRSGTTAPRGLTRALAIPGVAVHLYGKRDVRPRRKMGHVTAWGHDAAEVRARAEAAAAAIDL
jgi:5-(carboxyamino)imidazole ribonucleotide synthase